MSRKKWIWGISALLIVLGVSLSAWWFGGGKAAEVKVKTAAAENSSIQQEVYASGTVTPVNQQQVTVVAPSKISQVYVKVGDAVKPGKVLVQMDTTLADAQVAQARAGVNTAQTNLTAAQRTLDTLKSGSAPSEFAFAGTSSQAQGSSSIPTVEIPMNMEVSRAMSMGRVSGLTGDVPAIVPSAEAQTGSALQQAETAVSQAKAMLQQAQEGLKVAQAQRAQNVYTASIAGTVLELNAQSESMASLQSPLITIGDLSKLQVTAELNEVDAGKVQSGQKVKVTSKVVGNTPLTGAVSEVSPQAASKVSLQGNTTPLVGIKVDLQNIPAELKPGYTVDLNIATAAKNNVLAIPSEALFQESGKNYVFRVVNKKLAKTEVNIGIANETLQEITSGLKEGDIVVLNPTAQLANGLPVQLDTGSVSR
ncbi:efflux RND transporter periplasmic adaptor subunit [Desulfitobacterium sp. Sab5]|uniref:efflux RND transporter periplasmic adaptor subunit n=1 Tax=Desulfitobacterium nosdiversum TaxID=3375356 RepID=UPI003CFA5D6F